MQLLPLAQRARQATPRPRAYHQSPRERSEEGPRLIQQDPPALERLKATAAEYGSWETTPISKTSGADRAEEVLHVLGRLQQTLDAQQADQKSVIAQLTLQWEERFAQVMQRLQTNSSLTKPAAENTTSEFEHFNEGLANLQGEFGQNKRQLDELTARLDELEAELFGKRRDLEEQEVLYQPDEPCEDVHEATKPASRTGELFRQRLFRRKEAESCTKLPHRLDVVNNKLQSMSRELGLLRLEVASFKESSISASEFENNDSPPTMNSAAGPCTDNTQPNIVHEKSASFRSPMPMSTVQGLSRPHESGFEYTEDAMICGAGAPPPLIYSVEET